MVEIRIAYEGSLHCKLTHDPSGKILETDAPKDNMGKGESFSPTDLVAAALGSCMLTTMAIYAERHGLRFGGASATVKKEMTDGPPRRIKKLEVGIQMPAGLSAEQRQTFERVGQTCPVQKSLHIDIDVPVMFSYPD